MSSWLWALVEFFRECPSWHRSQAKPLATRQGNLPNAVASELHSDDIDKAATSQ